MRIKQWIKREMKKLSLQLKEQVWFPPNTPTGYMFRYGVAILLCLLLTIFALLFPNKEAKTGFYILSVLCIVISSFLGNAKTGVLILGFSSAVIVFLYVPSLPPSPSMAVEIISFLVTGAIIPYLTRKAKRMALVEEFMQRENVLKQSIALLSSQKEYAEKEIRVRDEFISIASHELKTPLTTTLLKLQVALHNVRHVSLANFSVQNLLDMLESAEHQSKRLAKMVNDLLNVSIIRTGRLDMEVETCDIGTITKEVLHRFSEKAERDGVTFHVEVAGGVVGRCDKVRLEQVVSNLISNAMKYGKGKPIDVTVTKQKNLAKISIRDRGIGISKDKYATIFNLFDRGVDGNDYKGLGIGLYISNQIVKAHGGRILIQSKINRGSEFIVEIPI